MTFINQRIGGQELSYTAYCQYRNLAGVCIACVDFTDPQVTELVGGGLPQSPHPGGYILHGL